MLKELLQKIIPKFLICIVMVTFIPLPTYASIKPKYTNQVALPKSGEDFPTDPFVRRQVRFWEAIFQKYKSNSVVIHDIDDPLVMIDVINFDHYIGNDGRLISVEDSDQTNLVRRYIDRYQIAVERFAKYKNDAVKFGAIEQRLFDVYQKDPKTLAKLLKGNVKFRGQGGLADTFLTAANRAKNYLPYMEHTFKKYGLPVALTRLPFVESMFNINAKSKVGASGLWQFMPETAKEYMYVGTLVDERNNPFKATHGAAQLFLQNYKELGSWPLAVTAYNHGRGGMNKASKELGTSQLGQIINHYRSPSFGFASKNFYAEFLAAARTYNMMLSTGIIKNESTLPTLEVLTLTKSISIRDIINSTNLSPELLIKYNPCINQSAITTRIDAPLPKFYELRLPKQEFRLMKKMLASSTRALNTR
jgi:membrane-bound lytic murein transglycosylase D